MTLVVLTNFFLWVAKAILTLILLGLVLAILHHVRNR